MSAHVPAWKRLGFKLKFAKELSTGQDETSNEHATVHSNSKSASITDLKRKSDVNFTPSAELATPPAKKARLSEEPTGIESNLKAEIISPDGVSDKKLRHKKSVTFTSDTKSDDGDSAQTIQLPALGSTQPKAKKKEKKPKSERKQQHVIQKPGKHHVSIAYLEQHYTDRLSWKFNKNREIWILKHALSTKDLPNDVNAALANYVHGLKSDGARQRLKLQSFEERTKSARSIDANEESKTEFYQRFRSGLSKGQLSQYENKSDDFSEWIKAQSRSAIILWALDETTQPSAVKSLNVNGRKPGTNGSQLEHNLVRPRAKKSKARTLRSDIDADSSSESDSDSTESSEDSTSSSGTSESDNSSGSSDDSD